MILFPLADPVPDVCRWLRGYAIIAFRLPEQEVGVILGTSSDVFSQCLRAALQNLDIYSVAEMTMSLDWPPPLADYGDGGYYMVVIDIGYADDNEPVQCIISASEQIGDSEILPFIQSRIEAHRSAFLHVPAPPVPRQQVEFDASFVEQRVLTRLAPAGSPTLSTKRVRRLRPLPD